MESGRGEHRHGGVYGTTRVSEIRVRPPNVPLVAVTWDDAHVKATGEATIEDIASESPYQFTTYGLLVRSDEQVVAIAAERGEDGRYRGVTYIPFGMVRQMVELGTTSALVKAAKRRKP